MEYNKSVSLSLISLGAFDILVDLEALLLIKKLTETDVIRNLSLNIRFSRP